MTIDELRSALFKAATWPNWIGHVQSYYFDRECIPLIVDGRKYGLEFRSLSYQNGVPYLEQMPYRDVNGEVFFPTLDHRVLSLWSLDENNDVAAVCFTGSDVSIVDTVHLAQAMRDAFIQFYRSHPQVSQYLFGAQEDFARFVKWDVLGQAPANMNIVQLEELAPPYYGFVVSEQRSAT